MTIARKRTRRTKTNDRFTRRTIEQHAIALFTCIEFAVATRQCFGTRSTQITRTRAIANRCTRRTITHDRSTRRTIEVITVANFAVLQFAIAARLLFRAVGRHKARARIITY